MTTLEILRAVLVAYNSLVTLVNQLIETDAGNKADIERLKGEITGLNQQVSDMVAVDAEAKELAESLLSGVNSLVETASLALPPAPVE